MVSSTPVSPVLLTSSFKRKREKIIIITYILNNYSWNKNPTSSVKICWKNELYLDSFQPINLIVKKNFSIRKVDIAIICVVEQVPQECKVITSVLGSFFCSALKHTTHISKILHFKLYLIFLQLFSFPQYLHLKL